MLVTLICHYQELVRFQGGGSVDLPINFGRPDGKLRDGEVLIQVDLDRYVITEPDHNTFYLNKRSES